MKTANILDPIHAELDPLVWDESAAAKPVLKPAHAHWIKGRVYKTLEDGGYTDIEKWLTLVFTGSLTTYQYSANSDVDISLFVDSKVFPEWSRAEMIALMVERLDGRTLPGTPFPLQDFVVGEGIKPSDLYKPGLRSGYNLDNGKWIVPPERDRVHDVRAEQGGFYAWALQMADKMERLLQYEPEQAIEFWHMIHKKRQRDMAAGKGDFSESNIVYKMLANRGLFPQISETSGEYIAGSEKPIQVVRRTMRHDGFPLQQIEDFENYLAMHNEADRDSGELEDCGDEEVERWYENWETDGMPHIARVADAPKTPPHLRDMHEPTPDEKADLAKEFKVGESHCGNCSMFWKNKNGKGHCWGYGEHDVEEIEVCDSWAPGREFHTSATDTGTRVLFHKFRPEQKHPPVTLGENSLPWVYEPATGIVHLGPPQSYHWELIERTPELRGQYENAWEGAPTNQNENVHGAMAWPSRKTEFMGNPVDTETKHTINQALGAPEEEGISWNFLKGN